MIFNIYTLISSLPNLSIAIQLFGVLYYCKRNYNMTHIAIINWNYGYNAVKGSSFLINRFKTVGLKLIIVPKPSL